MNNSSRLYFLVALLFTSFLSTNSTNAQNTLNLAGLSASSPSKVAYSLRRLSSSYSGNLIQVRRSSDNSTTEIGYDGSGHLDTNALKTFVGAGNGFVSIWYDQSGNANDAEQSTNGSQPQIVSAGVVLRSNSRPTVRFDGNTFIDGGSSAYSITNARTLNAVYNLQSGAPSHIIDRNVAGTPVYSIKGDNQGQIRNDASTIINEGTSQSAPFTNTFTMIWDGSNNINIFKNAVSNYSGSLSLPCTMDIMRIGRHYNNTGTYELNMWEVVLFPSAISSGDRLAMECNQQLYYNLPAPTVTSVTPLLGFPASSVSIVGTNFDAATSNNIVYFGATQAAVTSATTTTLNVTVPTGATYAPLTVLTTLCGLSVRSAKPYLPYYNNAAYVPATTNFKTRFTKSAGSTPMYLALGDMDGDGKTDIVTSNEGANTVNVLRNVSSGGTMSSSSFSTEVGFTTGNSPRFIRLGDIDGDGKLDIVVSNGTSSSISVFRNTSSIGSINTGSFAAKVDFTLAGVPANIAIADLDGDGRLDISVCNNGTTISVFKNTSSPGSISMATRADFTAGNSNVGLTAADLDGDGKIDLACSNNFASSASGITVLRNTTSGTISFASGVTFAGPWSEIDVITLDIDGDGKLDLAAVGQNGLTVWQNTATSGVINSGSFATRVDYPGLANTRTIASGDFDGDGRPDLVTTYYLADDTRLYRNLTTGSGSTITTSSFASYIAFPNVNQTGLAVGDLDGDGKADIVTGHNLISVLQNDPLQPITGTAQVCAGNTTTLANATTGGTWSSSNAAIATVGSSTGVVTGVSGGTVTITYAGTAGASFAGNRVTTVVTVHPMPSTFIGSAVLSTIITTTLSNAIAGGTWSSSNVSVATIGSSTGVVTGVAAGTSVITYTTAQSCVSTTIVTVNTPANALHFNGSDDVVTIPNNAALNISSNITIEAWINVSSTVNASQNVICKSNNINNNGYIFPRTDNNWLSVFAYLHIAGNWEILTAPYPTPAVGTWHHCALTYDGSQVTIYVDGQIGNTLAVSGPLTVNNNALTMGNQVGYSEYFTGSLDEARIWNIARTQAQIQADMNRDIAQNPNLVAYYKFNEGTAAGTNTGLTNLSDFSGNANCGSLSGFALSGSTSNYVVGAIGNSNTLNVVSPITGTLAVCQSQTTTLNSTTPSGVWSSSNTGVATVAAGVVTGVMAGTATISYEKCGISVTAVVTVNALPSVSAGSGVAICTGSSTGLTATGAATYSWSPATNLSATTGATITASPSITVTYTVAGTDGNGCVNTASKTVSVNPLPSYTLGVNKAICVGTPTSLTAMQSPAGNAVTFPGSGNNYISIPNATSNRLTTSNFSVSVWIRPTSTAHQLILYHGLGCVSWSSWFLGIGGSENLVNTGKVVFGFRTSNGSGSFEVVSPSNVTTNAWTHVFGTYDGTNLRLYLNGSLVATSAASGTPYSNGDNLSVGMDPGCGGRLHFSGSLDDLQLWNTTRSATDIANYYNQHVAASTSGIVGSWAFDEASGTAISDSSTSANNASIVGTLSRMIPTTAPIFGTPTSTFVWSPSASLSANTGTTVSATPTVTTTYTITGTDANSCINTSTITVSVNPLPTVSAGSNEAICNTFSANLTATGAVTYSWSPATNLSSTTGATITASPSSNVTYTVTGTDGNGCVNAASKTVSVNPLPTVSAGSSVAICNGNSTNLTATGAVIYSWSPATGLSATTGAAVTANPSTTITYTVTGTDGNSCSNTSSVTVTVNALPPVSAGPDVAICNTFTTNITATGAVDYTWSPATNLSATTGAAVTANPTSIITYTVTGTDGNGCINTASKTVSVNPLPGVFSFSTPNCIGTTTTITSSPSGGTWSSSNTGVATIGLNSGILNNVSTGTSNITYQLPVTGCYRVSEVTVNPFPAAISIPSALCPTQTATLTSASSGGTWSSTNASVMSVNSTTGEITAVINNYSGVSYTFIHYTLPTGCAVSRMVTVNPVPAPIFGGTTALCLGESTTLTSGSSGHTWSSSTPGVATVTTGGVVNSVGAGTTTISYTNGSSCATTKVVTVNGPLPANTGTLSVCTGQTTTLSNATPSGTWSSANNTVATVNTSTGVVSGLSGGTVNISYRIGATCFTVSQVTVNSNVAPVGGTKTVCVGTTTTLTYPVSGGTWSSATPAVATIDLNSGVVSGVGLGTSEITYTVAAGCFKTAIVTVTALPAAITGTALVCQGSATTLSNGSGTWSSSNTGIATVNSSGVVSGVSAGNANITFRASATGCYVTQEVTVNPLPVLVLASVCPTQTATLTATPSGGTWSISNPSTATVNTTTGELTGVIVNNTGISLAVVTYTSTSGCVKTGVITVNPVPSVISGGVRSICISGTTTLSSSTSGATWSSSTTAVATISVAGLVTGVGSGTTTISYTNASGCRTTAVMTVSALPVVPAITGTQTVCRLSTTSLSNATPGGTWSSSNNIIATVNSSGLVTGVNAGTARITYTAGSGCTAIATAVVTVNHIPSVTAISGTLSVCENATRTLSTISGGGVWSSSVPAVGSISTTGVVTGISAGNTMISYTVTNGFGCVGRSTAEVTVNPVPVVDTLTGTLSVCKDATTTLSSVTGGGVWTSSTPAVGTVNSSGVVTGVNAGTTTISYSVTNGFGCVTRVTKVVTVNPLPVINSLSGIFTTCENVNLLLNSNIPFGTWSSSNVSVATIDTFAGVLVPASVGTTLVTYNVLSTGCSSTIEATTIQAPAVIAGVTAMCPGGTTTLTTSPGGGTWTTSNSSVLTVNSATGEVAAVMVGYGGISVAGITYTIPNGCFRTVAPTVNPIPSPIYGGVTSICLGESTTFLSGSVGLTWSSSATGVATVSSGGVVTAQGAGVATISYTNSFGCANTRAVTVNAALSPNVGSSSICAGTTTTFTNAITGGTWTSSNVSKATINLTTGLVTATNAGTTTLSYRVPSGCYVTNVLTINTTPAVIGGTRSVCMGSTTLLGTTPSGGVWSSSDTSKATIGTTSGIVSGVTSGTATMTYTATGGCTRTAEVTVNALPAPITGAGVACAGGGTTALTNVSGTWTSSNTGIASVSYLGMVTGGSAGTAIITFRNVNNCATTKEVTINPLPATLVSPTGLCAGSTTTLTGSPSGGTWLSSNPSVFTVNTITGELTAVIVNITSNSLAVVTYTLPTGCSRTGLITINKQPSPIYGGTGKVCTGGTLAQYSGSSGYTWSSASPSIATISPTGVVTGVSEGNAVISYTSPAGCASQRVITVNATPAIITGASSVIVGGTTTLANSTTGGTWSSSTVTRATIGSASGVVTGVSIGTTNITYMMPTGCYVTRAMNVASAKGVVEGVSEEVISDVSIYPNPTTGTFSVSTGTGGVISVYTIDGKEVLQHQLSSGISNVTLPNTVAAGLYTCKFTDVAGRVTVMRLVYDNK